MGRVAATECESALDCRCLGGAARSCSPSLPPSTRPGTAAREAAAPAAGPARAPTLPGPCVAAVKERQPASGDPWREQEREQQVGCVQAASPAEAAERPAKLATLPPRQECKGRRTLSKEGRQA